MAHYKLKKGKNMVQFTPSSPTPFASPDLISTQITELANSMSHIPFFILKKMNDAGEVVGEGFKRPPTPAQILPLAKEANALKTVSLLTAMDSNDAQNARVVSIAIDRAIRASSDPLAKKYVEEWNKRRDKVEEKKA